MATAFALAAGCADHKTKVEETETHFLRSCESSCGDGLSCICGVCTTACSNEAQCAELPGEASCATSPAACGDAVERACDVTCEDDRSCASFGADFRCDAGRCRIAHGGAAGEGGQGGESGAGEGGQAGSGAGGAGGDTPDTGVDGGPFDGGPFDASDDGGGGDTRCDEVGEPCCDPFPQDGPNYCANGRLKCGASATCEVDCECPLGAFVQVCGVDGTTYDATCGDECVPVEIACRGGCPCTEGTCAVACSGVAPEQEAVESCAAIADMATCIDHETGTFPPSCRWITPTNSMCPPVP